MGSVQSKATAAANESSEIALNACRQPTMSAIKLDSGTPSTLAAETPAKITEVASPSLSTGTSCTATVPISAQNAPCASAPVIRAVINVCMVCDCVAARQENARININTINSAFREIRAGIAPASKAASAATQP